jgi:hypothetical protein
MQIAIVYFVFVQYVKFEYEIEINMIDFFDSLKMIDE